MGAWLLIAGLSLAGMARAETNDAPSGYYRFPSIHGDTIVFTAESDLWRVGRQGGVAQRLTSHPGEESHAAISPDGQTIAFSAQYEGPMEVYTMPIVGGLPVRQTYEGESAMVAGWAPDGKVLYTTRHFAGLPDWQLAEVDLKTGKAAPLPLSQASDGVFSADGKTLYFTRQQFQGSHTKRYQGGTAQNLWKYVMGTAEAVPLAADFRGTSKNPMWWQGRLYFICDRDGTMNLWSMNPDGGDLRQLTQHHGWDAKSASLADGRIVYQVGADLYLYDIAEGHDAIIPITLASDFDQEREKWIAKPMDYLTTAQLSPDGDRVVLTARGQVFVAPAEKGRFVSATHQEGVRYRQAMFLPDGKALLALSDATGELEFDQIPANGVGETKTLTTNGKMFRFDPTPSPDGKWAAYQDKNQVLWLLNLTTHESRQIAVSPNDSFGGLQWSPDSQWLAYVATADNSYTQIWLYKLQGQTNIALTSDRVNSFSPAWSADGKWLYFLSERHLESIVSSPWGSYEPEPFFNESVQIFVASLLKDGRSPFAVPDELHPSDGETNGAVKGKTESANKGKPKRPKTAKEAKESGGQAAPRVIIDLEGLPSRVQPVPVPPGNYSGLKVSEKQLYWVANGIGSEGSTNVMTLAINNEGKKPKVFAADTDTYGISLDRKKILIRQDDHFYVVTADAEGPVKLDESVNLEGWTFSLKPREEWREMFLESWRLMRDYFYDPQMNGVDWPAMRDRYLPLVDRITDRAELSDLIGDMVGELSALHIFVVGGDMRKGAEQIRPAALGAWLERDDAAGGYRIKHIYQGDPDYPADLSPLAQPGAELTNGEVIVAINGVSLAPVAHPEELLRNQAGKQVLLRVKASATSAAHEVIVKPIDSGRAADLRYNDWEYSRRLEVERLGGGKIGYVHLRAMGENDINAWARQFYPVFNRQGLIVDVRHNRGGNIDSWILEKLMRKAWFYWQGRVGHPTWNMQYAFRGHVVVLCDEHTASDGEAFSEGFKRMGIGPVIGTRTWGGEIWLDMDNVLVDKGIASAAELGVYGPDGKEWLIEGHGVDPDIVRDNLPHATFEGVDAQLQTAVEQLQKELVLHPVPEPPPHPPYPNKSFK